MGYYLPDDVIDHMVQNIADFKEKSDIVHGTVLFADAEKYSTLAETMEPAELKTFMNRFYEVLFTPVKKYQGRVLDVVGDAMLAIWYGESLSAETRSGPCRAALEMAAAVAAFNASADGPKLPVRIGLHSGHVSIGTVGAVDHYEYRAVGDCVNTASRLEGLNKYLKTRILVSEDVIAGIDDFLTRPLGRFILAGKVNALAGARADLRARQGARGPVPALRDLRPGPGGLPQEALERGDRPLRGGPGDEPGRRAVALLPDAVQGVSGQAATGRLGGFRLAGFEINLTAAIRGAQLRVIPAKAGIHLKKNSGSSPEGGFFQANRS